MNYLNTILLALISAAFLWSLLLNSSMSRRYRGNMLVNSFRMTYLQNRIDSLRLDMAISRLLESSRPFMDVECSHMEHKGSIVYCYQIALSHAGADSPAMIWRLYCYDHAMDAAKQGVLAGYDLHVRVAGRPWAFSPEREPSSDMIERLHYTPEEW